MAYSSLAEVTAFTRHLLNGQPTFSEETRPTATEITKFIARVSAILDTALTGQGLVVPITLETAKLVCDDWVTARVVEQVELTQRGVGYSDGEGSRVSAFRNLHAAAAKFAAENRLGFIRLGVAANHSQAEGLAFTGLDAEGLRSDPNNTTLEQPKFKRGLFSDTTAGDGEADD